MATGPRDDSSESSVQTLPPESAAERARTGTPDTAPDRALELAGRAPWDRALLLS